MREYTIHPPTFSVPNPGDKPKSSTALSPPHFNDFQFTRISQPELLKRFTEPDPLRQGQYQSPTPSPRMSDKIITSNTRMSPADKRRSLLETLQGVPQPMDQNESSRYASAVDSSANASNVTGIPVAPSPFTARRAPRLRPSETNAGIPLSHDNRRSSYGRNEPFASSPPRLRASLERTSSSINPAPSHDASMIAQYQSDSPSSLTAFEDSADGYPISPLSKSTMEQAQTQLSSILTLLNTLSSSFPPFPRTAVRLSAAAHALHHAQHTAQVAVKGSNSSFDIAQTMHTLAHHSQEAATRALDLAQQALAAAQAAHVAAEQCSASAQAAFVGCREARERSNEAVDAVQRVKPVLDAQEQDITRREELLQKMVVEICSAVEKFHAWAGESEVVQRRRGTDEKMGEKQRHEIVERSGTDGTKGVHHTETQRAGSDGQTRSIPIFGGRPVAGQITVTESTTLGQQTPQLELVHTTSTQSRGLTASDALLYTMTEASEHETGQIRQQNRDQAPSTDKDRGGAAIEPQQLVEKAGQFTGTGAAMATDVLLHTSNPRTVAEGGSVTSPTALVTSEATGLQGQSRPQAASLGPVTTSSPIASRNPFIPATTEAGRFLQSDLPPSNTTLASQKHMDLTSSGNRAEDPIFVRDTSSPLSELSSEDAQGTGQDTSTFAPLSSPSHHHTTSNVPKGDTPASSLPTWTVLKQEPRDLYEHDLEDVAIETQAAHPIALRSTPLPTPHVERLTTLRRVANASGISSNQNLHPRIKQEPVDAPLPRLEQVHLTTAPLLPGSVSPGDSAGNHPAQIGVTPPRMKKLKRTKYPAQEQIAGDWQTAERGDPDARAVTHLTAWDNTREFHSNGVNNVMPQAPRSGRDARADTDTGDRHILSQRFGVNGWTRDANGDARAPRERRLSDNRGEYIVGKDGFRAQRFDGYVSRDGVRGIERSWGVKQFRSPSPGLRQWGGSPPHRLSVRRDLAYPGSAMTPSDLRSPSSLGRFSRPILRHARSPPSSPASYNRSQPLSRSLAPPTSPQIGSRKRLRDGTGFVPPSEAALGWVTWNDGPDSGRPAPWQAPSDFSSPNVTRRAPSPSAPRTLASRMQEPPPLPLSSSEISPSDSRFTNPNPTRNDPEVTDIQDAAAEPRGEHRSHSHRDSFSDRERDYDPSVLGKRKKYRETDGLEFPTDPDGDRPHLLARMSDQTRSPTRGLGLVRGYSRGYERGRGFGRGRGAPFPRGGYRGSGSRLKPLQDRIH